MSCPLVPEARTEYHRRGSRSLFDFGRLWSTEGRPPFKVGWRDTEGGWIRWLWFGDKTGEVHALHVPSYVRSPECSGTEKRILRYFRSLVLASPKTIPAECPRCGAPTQTTPLTPPDEGVAFGCTGCSWPNPGLTFMVENESLAEVERKQPEFERDFNAALQAEGQPQALARRAGEIQHHALALVGTALTEPEAAKIAAKMVQEHINTGYYDGEGDHVLSHIVAFLDPSP